MVSCFWGLPCKQRKILKLAPKVAAFTFPAVTVYKYDLRALRSLSRVGQCCETRFIVNFICAFGESKIFRPDLDRSQCDFANVWSKLVTLVVLFDAAVATTTSLNPFTDARLASSGKRHFQTVLESVWQITRDDSGIGPPNTRKLIYTLSKRVPRR